MEKNKLDKLEDVEVTFGKNAFAPKVMYCDNDDVQMKKASIEVVVSEGIKVTLTAFRCPKCKEEMLGLDEGRKLDKALILSRALSKKAFAVKRKLSFDGDNFIFRIPNEFTQGMKNREVKVVPLEGREALIQW